jgi:hypothetical protein
MYCNFVVADLALGATGLVTMIIGPEPSLLPWVAGYLNVLCVNTRWLSHC